MVSSTSLLYRHPLALAGALTCLAFQAISARAADPFRERIVPFVKTYCVECHNAKKAEAELNLEKFDSAEMAAEDFRQWEHVITFVQREEMPPQTAKQQPPAELRAEILKRVRTVLDDEARKLAGDPGVVLPRRLTNAEYDHTIRDLTGVDIHPTRSFPVDPAAGEGFNNTGEALTMSPSLFAKLYASAQDVADHALLTTTGLEFAPYPVATFADRTKFYEQAILQFYAHHKIDYETYLTTCWEYRYRSPKQQAATIDEWASERGLSAKYLHSLDKLLQRDLEVDGLYVNWLRRRWNEVPAPADAASPVVTDVVTDDVRNSIHRLAREIRVLSKQLCPKETEAIIANAGNAPVQHLERRRKTAAERDTFDPKSIQSARRLHQDFRNLDRQPMVRIVLTAANFMTGSDPKSAAGYVILKSMNFTTAKDDYKPNDEKRNIPLRKVLSEQSLEQYDRLKFGVHPLGDAIDADACVLAVPGSLEIEVPAKALGDMREIRFFVDAELDRSHTNSGLATVSLGDRKVASEGKLTGSGLQDGSILLADPDHPATRDFAAAGAAFCHQFPNRFYFVDDTRGLSAGFHLIEGFFRDDQPLYNSVLNDGEKRELDRLWTELEFVTEISEKMLRGFVFFERSERNFLKHADFDSFKEEDPKLVEVETLNRFERVYLDRSNVKAPIEELTTHPIHIFFEQIRNGLKFRQVQLQQTQPIYLRNLETFAQAAYRRPLSPRELDDLMTFFRQIASQEEHGVEQAVLASLVRILVSPYFGSHVVHSPEGDTVQPLRELDLASRLSYFLWSSMPDAELIALAEAGRLRDEQVLLAQTRRMLKDARVSDFVREFFGQWLGYRDFVEQESVDRNAFKEFDEPLKQAMFEEPTRLATSLIQQDHPVTELLNGDATFVDKRLASHYGIPFDGLPDEWSAVDGLRSRGRGGILGMAVFLTKNSQPQRTSPVKRGFWVVHKVLGEHVPAPPADVVALPAKETDTNGKSIRELLALHVEAEKCARCHRRFDAVGLSMEGFDRIGRTRSKDLAGRPIDDVVRLSDGTEARGVPEFARHLVLERRDDYIRTLCRKLLGYALGRSLQLSDDVLLEEMRVALDKNGDRFVPLFETIVRSPQFRNQRCRDFSTSRFRIQNQGISR
jgi:hypothetical protein